jgi:hypothetical protein
MKLPHSLRFAWVILGSLLLVLPARAATPSAPVPGTLKVQVIVPPTWNTLVDDHISAGLVDRVRDVFYRAGFDRPIEEVRYVEDPAKDEYLLTINLVDWRMNRIGNVDCTFSASLRTPRGTRDLGLYNNTSMLWFRGLGRFGLSQSFDEAAEGAIRDLCIAVQKSELLPDFRRPEVISALSPVRKPAT